MEGFIQLHRKMLEWEWYDNINVKILFLHLLLKANWKDKKWRGNIIKRGTFITSLDTLSKETGLSVRNIRTSLDKLEMTNEVTRQSSSSNTVIVINNYDEYQLTDKQNDKLVTNDGQTTDKQVTTTNNNNNNNNNKIYKGDKSHGDIKIELNKFIKYWNSTFLEKRQVTPDLLNCYKTLRRKYTKEELGTGANKYFTEKKDTEKQYLLSPIKFFTQKNGLASYL